MTEQVMPPNQRRVEPDTPLCPEPSPGGLGLLARRTDGVVRQGWVIMMSGTPWSIGAHRQHALARQLARRHRVLYVDPPGRRLRWSSRVEPVAAGIWRVNPPTGLPLGRQLPLINRFNRWLVARLLRCWLEPRPDTRLLWIDEDLAAPTIGQVGEDVVVYDVTDLDWTFTRWWNRWHLRGDLRRAVRSADLVLASSTALPERLPVGRRPPVVLANGCDPELFRPDGEIPEWLDGLPRPLLAYLGAVDNRAFDAGLVAHLARNHPEWAFLLVGPVSSAGFAPLAGLPNVRLTGEVPYAEAPGIVRACDVGIIPYRVGGRVDYVHPKKCYEFLAAGKPVVATPLPALRPMADVVTLAGDVASFGAAVSTALATGRNPELVARRRAVAAANSWAIRGDRLADLLAPLWIDRC